MESEMKSVDDIAMAAVNAYFQVNSNKIAAMGYDEVASLYTRAYLESRKIVKKTIDNEKLNMFQNRVEKAIDGISNSDVYNLNLSKVDLSKLDLSDLDLPEDLGKQFK